MKRIYGLFLVLAFLISGNIFAQNTVLGRPVFEKTFYDHTYLDENGAVKIRDNPKVFKGEYFADELIVQWNKPKNSSITIYVARIDSLGKAMDRGAVREIVDPIPLRRNAYRFNQEDLAMQAESGVDSFYGVRFRTTTENQLSYWAREFERDSAIKSVDFSIVYKVADYTYNDPLVKDQWNIPKISAPVAHETSLGSRDVFLFVNDTGVFLDHEDLDRSRNFFDYDATTNTKGGADDYGHGTLTYGISCATTNNEKGIVGLAPNIMCGNLKVLTFGSGSWDMIVNGFLVAASKAEEIKRTNPQARFVMNLSLGGYGSQVVIDAAVQVARKAGIIIFAAAGNDGINIDLNPFIPASSPGVMAVAATDKLDKLAYFSNYGVRTVFLAAPGVDILSTVPTEPGFPIRDKTGYKAENGTSAASPQAAAYAALVLSTDVYAEDRLKLLLLLNNDSIAGLSGFVASSGRINLALGLNVPRIPPGSVGDFNADLGTCHSCAKLAWTSPGDSEGRELAGARLYFSTKEFNENTLNSKDVEVKDLFPLRKGPGDVVLFTQLDLKENSTYHEAIQVFDRGANFSSLTPTISFKTKESKEFLLRNFETGSGLPDPGNWTVVDGPAGELIKDFFGENLLAWHLSKTGAAGGSPPFAWRYGWPDRLNYKDINADVLIVSEVVDARLNSGLTIHYDRFQQIGYDSFGKDTPELYVKILDESNRGEWRLVKRFSILENSKTLKLEQISHDFTEFEGKKFQIAFRFVSFSSGSYIGLVIDNFEVRVDK